MLQDWWHTSDACSVRFGSGASSSICQTCLHGKAQGISMANHLGNLQWMDTMALFPNIGESIHKYSSHSKCWNMLEVGRVSSFNLLVFMMFFVCYYCIIDWNTTKGSKHPVPTSVDLVANGCRIPQRQSHEGYGLLGVTKMCDKHHISSYMAYMMTYMRQLFWIPIFMRTLLLSTWYTCMMEGKKRHM